MINSKDQLVYPITQLSPNGKMELRTNITYLERGYRLWYSWSKKTIGKEEEVQWFTNTDFGHNDNGSLDGTYGYIRAKWSDDNKNIIFTFHNAYTGDSENPVILSVERAFNEGKLVKL